MAAGDLRLADVAGPPGNGVQGAQVLLVDDSDIVRDVTRSLLEDAGITVEEAADGGAAVSMMRELGAHCRLILMDVQMPVLDGIAATRAIRAELGERAPPIVAMTAHATDEEKRACREAGMCDHLPKPVDPDQLIATVKRWLAPAAHVKAGAPGAYRLDSAAAEAQPALPPVPGFDLTAGLSCMGGKTALLRSQLARFGVNYADVVAELRQQVLVQNYRDARRVAHTVKGAAATLGGTAIAQRAAQVEQLMLQRLEPAAPAAVGAADEIDTALRELESTLTQALPALRAMVQAPAEAASPPRAQTHTALPPGMVAEYQALRELLAGNSYAARKAFAALRTKLAADDEQWRAAAAAVELLDFAQALAHLDARYPADMGKP